MTDEQVLEIVTKEFQTKSLGVTEQLLEIHSPVYVDGKIKIDRIDRERDDQTIIAYLPVLKQNFYFAVCISTDKDDESVYTVYSETNNNVYFCALSYELSEQELKAMTKLIPTESWNIGDVRPPLKVKYKFSSLVLRPNPEPDEFEDKLKKLLDFLEQDKEGILKLVENAQGYIQVHMKFHNGNTCLNGFNIGMENIRRMNDLNLSIDFDLYVEGELYIHHPS
jgi:hypothetical protein